MTSPPALVATLALALLAIGFVAFCLGWALGSWAVSIGVAALLSFGIVAWWWPRHRKRCKERQRAYVAKLRERGEDPVAVEFAARWKRRGRGISDGDVKGILASSPTPEPTCAHVVCLGMIDVPEVNDVFFEPEIITPTRYMGRQMVFIPIAGVLIFVWVLQKTGVLPFRFVQLSSFGYLLWMGAAVGGAWVWRSAVRPTYIRMAPGIIQILAYRYRRAKPTIRSYPMDGQTLAVLRGKATGKKGHSLALTLMRGEQKD
ncbi:MAG: hypothetical protein ACE5I3_09760, partial [Phycisphaerae bacterium]